MQKRIILALGISSIVGLVVAQEAPTEVTSLVAEQNQTPEVVKETVAAESVPGQTGDTSTIKSTSDSSASAPTEQTAGQTAPSETSEPAPQAAVTTSEPSPASIQDSSVTEQKKEFPALVATSLPIGESSESDDSDQDLEIKGIDTINVAEPKGNWLYKRIWWEKAERTYEKIKQLAEKIQEARILYFARRTDLDRNTMDPFYLGQGFNQGELTEIISYLTNQLDQERKDGSLDEKEQVLLNALTEEKKTLENLQKGVKAVANIDRALDDALLKLSEQLNQAHLYEQQAWENFKSINRELSDKRARELYYGMDTYWRNLNNINTYISDSFSQYFDQLADRVKQEIEKIKNTMDALKENGIDIQLQAQKLKAGKPTELEEEVAAETSESKGIFGTVWHWVKTPFVVVADMFGGLFGLITGSGNNAEELTLARPERSKE